MAALPSSDRFIDCRSTAHRRMVEARLVHYPHLVEFIRTGAASVFTSGSLSGWERDTTLVAFPRCRTISMARRVTAIPAPSLISYDRTLAPAWRNRLFILAKAVPTGVSTTYRFPSYDRYDVHNFNWDGFPFFAVAL